MTARPRAQTPRWRVSGLAGLTLVALVGAPAARAEPLVVKLKLETGTEYDTNIHRLSGDQRIATPVARGFSRLNLRWRPSAAQRLVFAGLAGVKLYGPDLELGGETSRDENVWYLLGDARYERTLPQNLAVVALRGSYYDALRIGDHLPVVPPRHFAVGGLAGELMVLGPEQHRVELAAGYRHFRYKLDDRFDWQGDRYELGYRTTLWQGDPDADIDAASFDVGVSYELQRRFYGSDAYTNTCDDGQAAGPDCGLAPVVGLRRVDLFHALAGEVVYTGDRIYSGKYELQVADSNSYGCSFVRHRVKLGFTTELFAEIFMTAEATLLFDAYLDSLFLCQVEMNQGQSSADLAEDDDNRNAVTIHLARDLSASWTLEGRYAVFSNEFIATDERYRRQLFYLGVVYETGR